MVVTTRGVSRTVPSTALLFTLVLTITMQARAAEVPFTYCIDYDTKLLGNEEFYRELSESPPDLFHAGLIAPFHCLLGAGDGYFYTDLYAQASPQRIRERIEEVSAFVRVLKRAGVKRTCPYVFSMGIFGNHETRTGFWEFYDDWNQYREFGFGPKPADDPITWTQRGRHSQEDKDFYLYHVCTNHPAWRQYQAGLVRNIARCGYDGVFMDVNTLACYNPPCQQSFDRYLAAKYTAEELRQNFGTSDLSRINLSDIGDRFERCVLGHFKQFLEERYDRAARERLFGTRDVRELSLENDWRLLRCFMQGSRGEFVQADQLDRHLIVRFGARTLEQVSGSLRTQFVQTTLRAAFHEYLTSDFLKSVLDEQFGTESLEWRGNATPRDLLLWAETQMLWSESMAGLFRYVKEVGRDAREQAGLSPDFFIDANVGTMAHIDGVNKRRVNGIDLNRWANDVEYMLFEEMQQPGLLFNEVVVDYLFHHKWAEAAGTRGCVLVYKVQDEHAAELANAEAAAGGSGGAFIQPGIAAPEARLKYRTFFEGNRALFEGNVSYADVGVAFFFDQTYYENLENLRETYQLVLHFADNHVLFDLVTEQNFDSIDKYRVVVLPDIRFMSDQQIARAELYAAQGGGLIIIGEAATRYMNARTRLQPGFQHLFDAIEPDENGVKVRRLGAGTIAWCQDPRVLVPERRADMFNLMEERANALYDAMEYVERRLRIEETVPALILDYIREIVGEEIAVAGPDVPRSLRLSAYEVPGESGQKRLVVHLVNYNLPIEVDTERSLGDPETGEVWRIYSKSLPAISARDVDVSIKLPNGAEVVGAKLHEPGFAPDELDVAVENGRANFVVPCVRTYRAAEILLSSTEPAVPGSN